MALSEIENEVKSREELLENSEIKVKKGIEKTKNVEQRKDY